MSESPCIFCKEPVDHMRLKAEAAEWLFDHLDNMECSGNICITGKEDPEKHGKCYCMDTTDSSIKISRFYRSMKSIQLEEEKAKANE